MHGFNRRRIIFSARQRPGAFDNRRLSFHTPSLAVHAIRHEIPTRFRNRRRPQPLGLLGKHNTRKRLGIRSTTPALIDCLGLNAELFAPYRRGLEKFRAATSRSLPDRAAKFLRRQPQLGEQLSHSSQSKPNVKLLCEKVRHNGSRPQAKVQAILAGSFAALRNETLVAPGERQTAWRGYRLCMQRLQPDARLRRRLDPFVDRRAVEAIGSDYGRRKLTSTNPLYRHQSNDFQRPMIKLRRLTSCII